MNDTKHFIALMKSKIKRLERDVVEEVSKQIEKSARANFNRARFEVPADDPNVVVTRRKDSQTSATVICSGDQVLFIEFGAGIKHSTETSTVGFVDNRETELAPRPSGIVGIGGYGKHRGKDDSWVYLSVTGRESLHSHRYGMNSRGEFRMFTSGIRPVRALWRARNTAIKNLFNKKIKRIAPASIN